LVEIDNSPVAALNRSVAVAYVHGPRAGIEAVEAIRNLDQLESYYLLYAVLGEFEERLKNRKAAAEYFRKSLELATIKSERKFFMKKIRALESGRSDG
jgi:RNA polymerase sigma-70 factor (ECF subfamily)